MRIIAGSAKGRQVLGLRGRDTRPTLDRVKESLFSIIQFRVPDATVLDLYAGSGNLGLEALSRSAKEAVFVDKRKECCRLIRKNGESLGFLDRMTVIEGDVLQALARLRAQGRQFDFIFLDPPYEQKADAALAMIFQEALLAEDGLVSIEHHPNFPPTLLEGVMKPYTQRLYGNVGIYLLEKDKP